MSNYFEYNDKIAFHPGYYIEEIVNNSGLSQGEFARKLGTTGEELGLLVRGEQRLSLEMASKLSSMVGTSVGYWMNLQNQYDEAMAQFN